ncbi:hypothetical protein KUCAC02_025648, partial [Chaenocephalus aceratus]
DISIRISITTNNLIIWKPNAVGDATSTAAIGKEDDACAWLCTLHSPGGVMENPFELPSHP